MCVPFFDRLSTASTIFLRWLLVVAVSLAIILSEGSAVVWWPQMTLVFFVLAGDLALMIWLARDRSWPTIRSFATGADIAAVSAAITVAGNVASEFYLVYFTVLIMAAVLRGRALLSLMALIACLAYGSLLVIEGGGDILRNSALLVRVPLLFGVALYFGTAVQTARREQERKDAQRHIERKKALSALTEMGRVALAGAYPGPVLYEIAGWVQEIVDFDRCSLLVAGGSGDQGYLAASGDDPAVEVRSLGIDDYPELGPALARGEYTEIRPSAQSSLWEAVRERLPAESPFFTFIVIPIKLGERVVGAFYLRDSDPDRRLSGAQHDFCLQAAQMAAAFIHEHDLLAKIENRSREDPLTGLLNYRAFIEAAEARIAASGARQRVSMAVVNIDSLADVNRRHGHDAGTAAIGNVARSLSRAVGDAAICRYGGGEFLVLAESAASELEARLQERFLDDLERPGEEVPTEPRASIGIATSPEHGDNTEELFAAAHKALRAAKEAGGNQIRACRAS